MNGGTLSLAQMNTNNDASNVNIAASGATLNLAFTGTGTLTITDDPAGYSSWADAKAPGQAAGLDHDLDGVENGIKYFMGETGNSFTALPAPDATNQVTWTLGAFSTGIYGTDFLIQSSSPGLSSRMTVDEAQVNVLPGTSISYTLPPNAGMIFVRLVVIAN